MIFSPTRQRRGWMRDGPAKKDAVEFGTHRTNRDGEGAPFDKTAFREKLNAAALSYGWRLAEVSHN